MQFAFIDEQALIRETVAGALERHAKATPIHRIVDDCAGLDKEAWCLVACELNLAGLTVPEAFGGAGLGAVELAGVMEALGYNLTATPFFTTVCLSATAMVQRCESDMAAALLPKIAAGEAIVAYACANDAGDVTPSRLQLQLNDDGSVSGAANFVQYADIADFILAPARTRGGDYRIVVLERHAEGLKIDPLTALDLTRPVSRISFENAQPVAGLHDIY